MEGLCEAKTELFLAYQKAAEAYSQAVSELARHTGTVPHIEYERLRKMTDTTRDVCTAARDALDVHTYEHGC
jgi:hypothetical protein